MSCNGQSSPPKKFFVIGTWKLIGKFTPDNSPLTSKERRRCLGDTIIFMEHKIIASNDYCFMGFGCLNPNYSSKKVNILDYLKSEEPDTTGNAQFISVLDKMRLKNDSIYLINTSCEVPYNYIYVLDYNHLFLALDGYLYWFERTGSKNK
jgi:hypothetical protein